MNREEFERQIVAKSQKDPAFRQALLADPKATLQAELQSLKAGVTLPAELKVSVVEESASHIYLRIPAAVHGTLSEKELVAMSGGASEPPPALITGVMALDVTASAELIATVVGVVVAAAPPDPTSMTVTYAV